MLRVSKNLLLANLLIGAALAGCGGDDKTDDPNAGVAPIPGLIQFSPMYSAYDGTNTYQVSPFLPAANPANKDSDPIVESSIKWTIDSAYLKQDPWSEIPGATLLTTKKAGMTTVSVNATRMSGAKVRGQSTLTISAANVDEWQKGSDRYANGMMINLFGGGMGVGAPTAGGMPTCGIPIDLTGRIPTNSACTNCHNNMGNAISVQHTPTQTAGYSNDELIEIFTNAQKPAGGTFNSPILKNAPMPDCIYKEFHTWQIDDDTKIGIVWKLRSITPMKQQDVDFAKLAQQAMAARQAMMNGGGAAGSGM